MSGNKRKNEEDDLTQQVYSNKSRSRPSVEARVDPTYGQRSALPGLDEDTALIGSDEELNYDDGMDALAYLRAVRLVIRFCSWQCAKTYLHLDPC